MVGFDSPLFGIMESSEELTVTVSVHAGTLEGPVEVYFTSASLDAAGKKFMHVFNSLLNSKCKPLCILILFIDEDYICSDQVLIFSESVSTIDVTCSIVNNDVVDGTRKFKVMLTALNRDVQFDESTAIITITDDDSKV